MRPLSPRAHRGGVALEQRMLRLRVERGGGLVEHQQRCRVSHEPARQRSFCHCPKLISAPPGHVGPSCVSRPAGNARNNVLRPGARDGRHRQNATSSSRGTSPSPTAVPCSKLKPKESWNAPASGAPRVGVHARQLGPVDQNAHRDVGSYIWPKQLDERGFSRRRSRSTIATTGARGQSRRFTSSKHETDRCRGTRTTRARDERPW